MDGIHQRLAHFLQAGMLSMPAASKLALTLVQSELLINGSSASTSVLPEPQALARMYKRCRKVRPLDSQVLLANLFDNNAPGS